MKQRTTLASILALLAFSVGTLHAQVRPTLEWSAESGDVLKTGTSTTPFQLTFMLDEKNYTFGSKFSVDNRPLKATVRFENQQYYTKLTGSSTEVAGLTFGARNTSTSHTDVMYPSAPGVQTVGATNLFSVFGAGIPIGKPRNAMFMSSAKVPSAAATSGASGGAGINSGGFDVDGLAGYKVSTGNSDDQNFGLAIYTSVEPLHDVAADANGRFYFGDVVIQFNRPVKNPVVHLGGLGGNFQYLAHGGILKSNYFTTELELANGSSNDALQFHAGNTFLKVENNKILNSAIQPDAGSTQGGGYYGAASGSVIVKGSYSTLVFKVYMKGAAGNISWSAGQADIVGATRDPFNGDLWYLSVTNDKPKQQVAGYVFFDKDEVAGDIWKAANGDTYETTDGSAEGISLYNNERGVFYAYLLNANGTIQAVESVGKDGSFLFDEVNNGTYRVGLSSKPQLVGASFDATLPMGWMHTGQQLGMIAGNDGSNEGSSPKFLLHGNDLKTEVIFGVTTARGAFDSNINFSGVLENQQAKLQWLVTNELAIGSYILERSFDGVRFNAIHYKNALGTASTSTYQYSDVISGLGNKFYYRLKTDNKDGSSSYSNVVILKLVTDKFVRVLPNPFKESFTVEIDSKASDRAVLRVINTLGKTLVSKTVQLQPGVNHVPVNGLQSLSQGSYMLEIKTDTETFTEKLIKKHK